MRKVIVAVLAAFLCIAAQATTYVPVGMLNPGGSTSGQVVVSTGASTSPTWGSVGVSGLAAIAANTVLANATASSASPTAFAMTSCSGSNNALRWTSGTGFTCASGIALTSSGLNQFASTTSAQLAGIISDESGSGSLVFGTSPSLTTPAISGGTINSASVGATTASTGAFTTLSASSTVSGAGFSTYLASPPAIGGTAAAAGSFTTLSASSTVSGTGFTTYLASPPSIGGTTAAAGAFTTLSASGNDALTYTNTSAQSFASGTAATVTTWTKTFDRLNTNFNASTGTFTAPATGYYHVDAGLNWSANAPTTLTQEYQVSVVANGTGICTGQNAPSALGNVVHVSVVSCDVSLTSGQTIVIQGFQNSGAAVTLSTGAGVNYVSINRIP